MKTTFVILLTLLATGLYPDYAHYIVNATTELLYNIATPNHSGLKLIILVMAIVLVAHWK